MRIHEFARELKALLEKYGATIGFSCDDCSDLYGIQGEHTYIEVGSETVVCNGTWKIDSSDLKS